MDNQPSTDNSSHEPDKRQRANSNPDRPPVEPDQPGSPDPFDPFETAHMTDGGAVIQDETELSFETELSKALPSTQTPVTPDSPSQNTSTSIDSSENDAVQTGRTSSVQVEEGTLVQTVVSFLSDADSTWSYVIEGTSEAGGLVHHAVTEGDAVFSIRETRNKYSVSHEPGRQHIAVDTSPVEHRTFEQAMAAFIEGIDWGTLPPGNGDPQIWTYHGYTNSGDSFQEYLSGADNDECGGHYFVNEKAGYRIQIESFADLRDDTKPGQTITIVTITKNADGTADTPIYRTRFGGQQTAFNTVLSALANGLSSEIALHNDSIGNTDWIPTVTTLQKKP